jgi:hypothetical protein
MDNLPNHCSNPGCQRPIVAWYYQTYTTTTPNWIHAKCQKHRGELQTQFAKKICLVEITREEAEVLSILIK